MKNVNFASRPYMYFSEQGNVDDDATFITIFLVSFNLQSCCLMQSAVCSLQSAVCSLQSAVCGLQSANVIHRTGKSALILIKLLNLKVIHLSDVCTFSDVCMTFTPHHTNICKSLWLWGATSLLVFNKSLSNFVILLTLRCSFQLCWRIFP